ncbi:MAG: methylated-DNA--[protein]-cysteine S-methyltransferase [Planctomycetes bacterium]|nr:methylated-DNA--[protein]-cysteine S-methyltransferase [Planctomycetota bacterium]
MTTRRTDTPLIRFAFAPTDAGRMLVAASERGVCSIMLGNDNEALLAELRGRFPGAAFECDDESLAPWVAMIRAHMEEGDDPPVPPLDMEGSAFQISVWSALMDIPRGETRSYAQIARAIENPSAVRAVGRACAMNRIAILVPCHRAVRSDGTLAGFRWGVERKRRLLEIEHRGLVPLSV